MKKQYSWNLRARPFISSAIGNSLLLGFATSVWGLLQFRIVTEYFLVVKPDYPRPVEYAANHPNGKYDYKNEALVTAVPLVVSRAVF